MKCFYERKRTVLTGFLVFATLMVCSLAGVAQEKVTVQIKTFTQQLEPFRNIEVSINGKPFVDVGAKGAAITNLDAADFPIRSISIRDEKLEAASWLFTKGVVEIIVRTKSYQVSTVLLRTSKNEPVAGKKVVFEGKKRLEAVADNTGKVSLPLALDESIASHTQFSIAGYDVREIRNENNQPVLIVEPVVVAAAPPQTTPTAIKNEFFSNFDMSKVDSIQSLTMFYAIFRDYQINDLSPELRRRVDQKFNQLIRALEDSVQRSERSFIGRITDSTLVKEDIVNLIKQAREESETLTIQREAFDEKINLITRKLDAGISGMDDNTRAELLSELSLLEQLLIENESRFFKNQTDYRRIINTIRENYFNLTVLEDRLSESEAQRLLEQQVFRQRLMLITALVILFGVLIVLLVFARKKLQRQTVELARANTEVKRINETLEQLVYQRTRSLAEAHKELDTFLYRASHDMRSPVRSVIGLCNIAATMVDGEPRELIERVVTTTMGMDKLLKKLSLISEINEPTNYDAINVCEVIEEIYSEVSATVKTNTQFNLSCGGDITINSYRNLVFTILQNVIENGLVFGAMNSSRLPRLDVKVERSGEGVSIAIEDNGPGFDIFVKERIFDMFFKGTEKSTGHGLGLYIVSKAVAALSGTIDVESAEGHYTRFTLWLPANAGKADASLLERKAVA